MDVKNISSPEARPELKAIRASNQKPAAALSSEKVNVSRVDPVRVEVSQQPNRANSTRKSANDVINTLNVVSTITEEIDKIVTSLAGLADQASATDLPDSRRQILEDEAQQLLSALDERSQVQTDNGAKPLSGDPIELEVEEEFGKALKVILPETSKEQLGLGDIAISKVETILATRRSIGEARERLEELRSTVLETQNAVSEVLQRAEIASANQEASGSTIRDVDEALKLTGGIQSTISEQPAAALEAAQVSSSSIRLLSQE
ncbi:hypothetical protein MRY87_09220 [bacterium]|nr:hypothetical protein [bacterium]